MKRFLTLIKGGAVSLALLTAILLFAGCDGSSGPGDPNSGGGGNPIGGGGGTPVTNDLLGKIYITGFCVEGTSLWADGNARYVDVKIPDVSELDGASWTVYTATYNFGAETLLTSQNVVDAGCIGENQCFISICRHH